jgi:uncharacterized protein
VQFIVTGLDGKDAGALDRRMASRQAHLEQFERMKAENKFLFAAAILDEQEKMIGSIIFCDFKDRTALDEWLKSEPYVLGDVWRDIDVKQCKVVPSCLPVTS